MASNPITTFAFTLIMLTAVGGIALANETPAALRADQLSVEQLRNTGLNVRKVFYWEKKDLATYVILTKHLLATAMANATSERDDASAFGARVLGLGYDLASMTWTGWDEAGIEIAPSEQAAGLEAAELIVRLSDEHNLDANTRHNNYWMLGAQRLAAGDTAGAITVWERARDLGVHANTNGMNGWLALAAEVDGADPAALDTWLAKLDDGDKETQGQAAQIRTARRVFVR